MGMREIEASIMTKMWKNIGCTCTCIGMGGRGSLLDILRYFKIDVFIRHDKS